MAIALLLSLDVRAAASRRITVRTDDGATLAGTYFESSRRPSPGIVLLHMLTRTHDDWQAAGSRLADAGTYQRTLRSLWKVKGTVSYRRKMKDIKAEKDAWYLMASTMISALTNTGLMTGNFEETTGDVDYIDLRYPHYVCGVELLEAEER